MSYKMTIASFKQEYKFSNVNESMAMDYIKPKKKNRKPPPTTHKIRKESRVVVQTTVYFVRWD